MSKFEPGIVVVPVERSIASVDVVVVVVTRPAIHNIALRAAAAAAAVAHSRLYRQVVIGNEMSLLLPGKIAVDSSR